MSTIASLRTDPPFPGFQSCPDENDIDMGYYDSLDGRRWFPTRHWCLLAEIIDVSTFIRLRLLVKDRDGHEFLIAFHLEPDDTGLDPSDFRQGHTVAILYAHQHGFLDFSVGVRQEEIKCVQAIPLSLLDLFALSDRVQDHNRLVDGKHECHACGVRKESLMKCGKCSLFWYCDKDCQTKGWKEKDHRKDCKVLKDIKGLFTMEWDHFDNFAVFPL